MSITETIRKKTRNIPRGKPFTTRRFLQLGSTAAVNKALSRLTEEKAITRVAPGIYVRPQISRFVGEVMPEASEVVRAIARERGESIQIHGAEAARRFRLSTQVPMKPVYYTSGTTRTIRVGNLEVQLTHASPRRLQHAGKRLGVALSALWYLGKENINEQAVKKVCGQLNETELEALKKTDMPAWLSSAIKGFANEEAAA